MQTWVESAREDRNFTIHNIPFGLVSTKNDSQKRPATRLGDYVVDLSKLAKSKSLQGAHLSEAAMHSLSAVSRALFPGTLAGRAWPRCSLT